MKRISEETIKKIDYLLESLMYIKHDAFNCKCQRKKRKVMRNILGLLGFNHSTLEDFTSKINKCKKYGRADLIGAGPCLENK